MQKNVVSARVAATIRKEGCVIHKASVTLTSGVGGQLYGVEGIMNVNISLTCSKLEACKHFPILNDYISTIQNVAKYVQASKQARDSATRHRDRPCDREQKEEKCQQKAAT